MTYEHLKYLIECMTWEQRQSDVTVEVPDEGDGECYKAELRYCGEEHPSLDEDHPVLFVRL